MPFVVVVANTRTLANSWHTSRRVSAEPKGCLWGRRAVGGDDLCHCLACDVHRITAGKARHPQRRASQLGRRCVDDLMDAHCILSRMLIRATAGVHDDRIIACAVFVLSSMSLPPVCPPPRRPVFASLRLRVVLLAISSGLDSGLVVRRLGGLGVLPLSPGTPSSRAFGMPVMRLLFESMHSGKNIPYHICVVAACALQAATGGDIGAPAL